METLCFTRGLARFGSKIRQTTKFAKNAKITKGGIDKKKVLLFLNFWAEHGRPVCPINIKLKSQGVLPFLWVMPILAFLPQSPILSNSFARNQILRALSDNELLKCPQKLISAKKNAQKHEFWFFNAIFTQKPKICVFDHFFFARKQLLRALLVNEH